MNIYNKSGNVRQSPQRNLACNTRGLFNQSSSIFLSDVERSSAILTRASSLRSFHLLWNEMNE